MSFGWLIWLLIFIFFLGSDNRLWGSVWPGWGYRTGGGVGRLSQRRLDDMSLRMHYRKKTQPDVVVVSASDYIAKPDPHIEDLIELGKIDEAWEYRSEMENIAEEMDDEDGLRKYAIYGARISARQKELAKQKAFIQPKVMPAPEPRLQSTFLSPEANEVIHVKDTTADVKATTSPINIAPPLWTAKKTTSHLGEIREKQPSQPPETPPTPPTLPEPPKPPEPEIPADFTPPPPGPVKLDVPGLSEKAKPEKIPADKRKKAGEEKIDIDPDDYSDLISI